MLTYFRRILLTVPRWFLCCSSSFFVRMWFNIQLNLYNSKSKGPNSFVWIIETLNNWGLKCIHIFKSGLQNDFELLRILNYWSLNYRGSTVCGLFCPYLFLISPSFGASGVLCFVIVTFPRYLHLYFCGFLCLEIIMLVLPEWNVGKGHCVFHWFDFIGHTAFSKMK